MKLFDNSLISDSLSQKAFEVLRQMAESHAKLCFRSTVTVDDVLGVINICEKLVRALFDQDSYSSPPESKFMQIGDIDEYRNQLHEWLVSFIENILQRPI